MDWHCLFQGVPQIQHHSCLQFAMLHVMCMQPPGERAGRWSLTNELGEEGMGGEKEERTKGKSRRRQKRKTTEFG